ncbi:hypothetical protein AAZX31_15G208400 [Glycine max]
MYEYEVKENKDAIELVQKAFDEILLPEPEDLFSDDQFKFEGIDSDEVHLEKSEVERKRNTSTSTESPTAQRMGTKPDQRAPRSWSNLKKLILLKRFVNALEKVRNINPKRPRRCPSDANLEIGKVFLKHQTVEEKKNVEEWMLDYALQKTKKVTLLVKAFETILPFQVAENSPRFSPTMEPQANPVQPLDNSSNHSEEETSFSHDSSMELTKILPVEIIRSSHEEAPTNETVNDVPEDLLSNMNTENPDIKFESPGRDVETKNLNGDNGEKFSMSKSLVLEGLVRSLKSNLIGSGAPVNEPTANDRKEGIENVKQETKTLEEFPTKEQYEAHISVVVEPETPHMVSNMDENNSESLIDGADEKESGFDGSRTRGASFSHESTPVTDQEMKFKDHVVADPEVARQQNEAIKMVEEAIDSMIPDDQDDLSDKESLTDSTISDNSKQSNRTERKMSTSWSNLKKVILLRRFIKSLEKVRKFNPRGPRYLPLEPNSEAEKVNLRHQDMEERKGTEEWMLDYALRQVVSKLTPARKRKVELLPTMPH